MSFQQLLEAVQILLHPVSAFSVFVIFCFFDPLSACGYNVVLPQLKMFLHNVLEAWWWALK